jgi:hypothetical protein
MNRTKPLGALVLAALVSAAPAFAQTSGLSAQSSATTQSTVAKEQARASAATNATHPGPATFGPAPAPKPSCAAVGKSLTGSMGEPRDCVPEPYAGSSNAPNTTGTANSLDASGTFSSSPALSPTPDVGVDARVASPTTATPGTK